jgi:hypothetical protein
MATGARLACLALGLWQAGLAAQQRGTDGLSAGLGSVLVASDPWFGGVGAQIVIPAAYQIRFSLLGAVGERGDRFAGRAEAAFQFVFGEPGARRRVAWYGGAGLAATAGWRTDGYLLLVAGLEGSLGARGHWWVDGGVAGGVRLAMGYRWRPAAWRRARRFQKKRPPTRAGGRSLKARAYRYSALEPATSGLRCTGLLNRSPNVRT